MADQDVSAVDFALKERAMDEAPVGITIADPDRPDNPLIYVNEAFERVTGYAREEALGRNCRFLQGPETDEERVAALRTAIDAGEAVTVELRNYRPDGEPFWNQVTVAPVRDADGEVANFVGFQADVTRRKEAERTLEAERERLDTVFDRVNRLLDAVTTAIVTSTSRPELERSLCEGLVEDGPCEGAWIGAIDAVDDVVVPSFIAGTWPADPPTRIPVDGDHPAAVALRDGTLQGLEPDAPGFELADRGPMESRVSDGVDASAGADANTDDDEPETGTPIAIPLRQRDEEYGVLTVYLEPPVRIDERESTVFTAVGRAVASAMSVLETRRILVADEIVEAELSVADPDLFFVRITDLVDCRLSYEGAVADADAPSLFFTAYGASSEDVLDAAARCPGVVGTSTVTETGDAALFEFELQGDAIVGRLAAFGAETRSITARDGVAVVTFTLPAAADLRSVVERIRDRYPGTELVSMSTRERPPETRQEYFARIEAALTDRQLGALQTAYLGGYFDRPRRATGDDLADAMGLTRSTFHQHLRVAQRKLLSEFFDR